MAESERSERESERSERESESAASDSSSHRVLRISQLDAFELDDALEQLVWSQFSRCFRHLKPGVLSRVEPELRALLQLLVWRFSVYSGSATAGQTLLNLRYRNALIPGQKYRALSRKQKLWLALLTVGVKWLRERCHSAFLGHAARPGLREALRALALISSAGKVANLINFLLFLQSGAFPSLTEWMLGVRPEFVRDRNPRQIDFHHMNRELLWHGFSEFLIFLLPLIDVWKLKGRVTALFSGSEPPPRNAPSDRRSECGICGEWPVMPHSIGCSHVFCYYCVKSRAAADVTFACPRCGAEAVAIQPVERRTAPIHQT